MAAKKGTLYLIPTFLGHTDLTLLSPNHIATTCQLDEFIVENLRNARRFLVSIGIKKTGKAIDDLTFHLLDKHKQEATLSHYLKNAELGKNIGLLSDAGCPAIADPGSAIVRIAHQKGLQIIPLIGPSSILLALMASGMNGQNFSFIGYLPIKKPQRTKRIVQLEQRAWKENQTQAFIETPYRNLPLFNDLLKSCRPQTRLCIATNLTLPTAQIWHKSIEEWRAITTVPAIQKQPTIFLLGKP